MKYFKHHIAFLAVFAMLFTSCSKEESGVTVSDQDTVQLQLGALLNNFETRQASKAHLSDPTECRDAAPAYVRLGLTDDATGFFVGGAGNTDPFLINVNIKNNGGSWETEYSEVLGLPAGDYTLQYFIVYSSDNEVLWVAPRAGGDYASSVGSPLPMAIDLEAGTKPYIMVDVLCYIPRNEEAYGYVFFDIDLTTVENNYCIFVNYCDDGTGREYPAKFMVDVWADGYDGTDLVIDGAMNSVSGTGNSFAATVLCMALPPLEDGEMYYVRVSVLSAGAYTADGSDVKEFTINQADISAQINLTPKYEHVRINCGDDDGGTGCNPEDPNADCDDDGVLNGVDECKGEGVRGSVDEVGCPIVVADCTSPEGDCDGDSIKNKCDDDDAGNINFDSFDCDGDTILNGQDLCEGFDDRLDLDSDGIPDACDDDRDGDSVLNGSDSCPDQLPGVGYLDADLDGCNDDASCISDIPVGCERFSNSYSKDATALQIIPISIGDLTLEFVGGGLSVGLTPVAPFEFSDIEVTIGGDVVCIVGVVPDAGGSTLFAGLTPSDLPITIGLKVNYCNVAQ